MTAYYNENEPYAAAWLKNLITAGHIAPGDVDDRSIADVVPSDLDGYRQVHLFAGIGGWSLACRLAGWPDDRECWTGSCPCQPFSVAGKGAGASDERHLWPYVRDLVAARRPVVLMGEQVAAAVGKDWLDGVFTDLEGVGYACGAVVVPACSVNAPHRRDRLWFVAERGTVADAGIAGLAVGEREPGISRGMGGQPERQDAADDAGAWAGASWIRGADGKTWRSPQPGVRLLDDGLSDGLAGLRPDLLLAKGVEARVGKLRALGNAIVAPLAAEIIAAYLDCRPC